MTEAGALATLQRSLLVRVHRDPDTPEVDGVWSGASGEGDLHHSTVAEAAGRCDGGAFAGQVAAEVFIREVELHAPDDAESLFLLGGKVGRDAHTAKCRQCV